VYIVTTVLALAAALEPAQLRLLPPDAGFVLGIEVRQVLETSAGKLLEKRLPPLPGLAAFEKLLREDIDSLLVVGTARDLNKGPRQGSALAILRGRFEREALRKLLSGRVEAYGRFEVWAPSKIKPATSRVVLLDAGTLMVGERPQVVAALDRLLSPRAQVPVRLVERAQALAGRHHLWVAVEAPPGGFPVDKGVPQAQFATQLTGLDGGVSFGQGLDLEVNLRAASEASARDLAAAVQGLVAMAALQPKQTPEAAEVLRKLQVLPGADGVALRLALTQAELERSMTAQAKSSVSASAPPAAAPAAPAGPRKIRIVGLEQGPVEVPVR
jgi:hypothetical protein